MTNKIALVTGGNKGIGFAICKGLLATEAATNLSSKHFRDRKEIPYSG